jgi:hypothetical protein
LWVVGHRNWILGHHEVDLFFADYGDLLKLVHLSNGFRMVGGMKPLQVGDAYETEARIVSVTNTNEGKIVKVKGRGPTGH